MEKITKLISLSDFVDHIDKQPIDDETALFYIKVYNNFLKQPLTLGMFVTTSKTGKYIEEPEAYGWIQNCGGIDSHLTEDDYVECEKYHECKFKVLFEGFFTSEIFAPSESFELIQEGKRNQICIYKARPDYFVWNYKTIEDLARKDLILTESALKKIYG